MASGVWGSHEDKQCEVPQIKIAQHVLFGGKKHE
jgi:hypothetical protein